jgi:hypothetical protein
MASCPGDRDQDGAVPDYRDGRDIRAFAPVFDGCCLAMTKWELPRVLPPIRQGLDERTSNRPIELLFVATKACR